MAFAYGSAVFKQTNNVSEQNMLDLVLVVDDVEKFHEENLRKNREHYSFLRSLGPKVLARVTDWPAHVYFNTAVRIDGNLLKYGIISKDRLIADLLDWDVLYIAGRLQKPVKFITEVDPEVGKAQEVNLRNAIHVALLTLPETFSLEDLFLRITGISYEGDFRMRLGEDKNKIMNIVRPGMQRFSELYIPFLASMTTVEFNTGSSNLHQDLNEASRLHHLELLPKTIQHQLTINWRPGDSRHKDVEDVLKSIAKNPASISSEVVLRSVRSVVRSSALKQSLKGLISTDPITALRYCASKLSKMFKSLRGKS